MARPGVLASSLSDESAARAKLYHSILTQLPQYLESGGPSWDVAESATRISIANGLASDGAMRDDKDQEPDYVETDRQQLDTLLRSFFCWGS